MRKLANWVCRQRRKYIAMNEFIMKHMNNPNPPPRPRFMMTDEEAQRLTDLGMIWDLHEGKMTFDDYFEMLLEYRAREGHVKVPQADGDLGGWVHRMRGLYRLKTAGVPTKQRTLTDERIAQLESIGFVWKTKKTPDRDYSKTVRRKKDNENEDTDDEE